MRFSTASLLACLAAPALVSTTASAALRFEEFLINGTGAGNHFFEFSAQSTSDFGAGTALIVISGDEDTAGNITGVLDLNLDFTTNSFPTNNLFLAQPVVVTGTQPDPGGALPPGILDYNPDPDPATFFLGGGDVFFPTFPPSVTVALVDGFTGSVGTDLDSNNDGTIDGALPFSGVHDAVTLLDSNNNIEALLNGTEATTRFTGQGYADDFSTAFAPTPSAAFPQGQFAFFDQRFDETVGVSPDGPDGFFRFTDGTPATFDVNVNDNGLDFVPNSGDEGAGNVFEFDGATFIGGPNADEEIAFINTAGQVVDAAIPSDQDPVAEGDQGPYLTPGSANNIALPSSPGAVLPDPVAQGLEVVTDTVRFGEDRITPTGERIAGTSFENEAAGNYIVNDEIALGNLDGDGNAEETLVGFSELVAGDDINGDGDFADVFFLGYRDQRTDSGDEFVGDVGPLGADGVASNTRLALENDPNQFTGTTFNTFDIDNRTQFDGDDDTLDTADDVFFDSVIATVNSTSSSDAAGDLGFNSTYIDTRATFENGFADGDVLGVVDFDYFAIDPTPGGVADGRDGNNVFAISDTDGSIEIEFDAVDLSSYEDVVFQALIGVNDTGYEAEDLIRIELDLTTGAGTETIEALFFEGGSGLEGIGIFGELTNADGMGQFLYDIADDVTSAVARFTFSSSSGAENYLLDDVAFFGTLVAFIDGDFNDDGAVDQGDLDLVLLNWGQDSSVTGVPTGWVNDQPTGLIGQSALDEVLLNWGATSETGSGSSVPEPGAGLILLAGAATLLRRRRD